MMRVLIATDGSAPAGLALELVEALSWPAGTTIQVVESIDTGPGLFGGPWPAVALVQADRLEAVLRVTAGETVDQARARLTRPDLNVQSSVLRGRPATAIVDAARTMNADVIIVGSRGHGTIEGMLLGSVSAEVIDRASTPVLVARGTRINKIILAWDGSPSSARAAEVLRGWSIFRECSIRVVSVADVAVPWWTGFPQPGSVELMPWYLESVEASRREHDALAEEMTSRLTDDGLKAEPERRDGDAATEILAAADAFGADLILVGTHGRSGLARLVLGSVARNVLQHARCSVLVVRESSRTDAHTAVEGPRGN